MSFICIICRDVLKSSCEDSKDENQLVIVATKCGHLFHLPCLSNWFHQCWKISDADSHPRCPCCKSLSYVHELVRLYPAQESTVAVPPSMQDGRTRISPSEIDSATAQLSTTMTALKKSCKTLIDDIQTSKSTNSIVDNSSFHDKSTSCTETLQTDMIKLQHDFEELSQLCKSSELRWGAKQEKQRQEIIFLKHQNQKLVKEIKYQINCAASYKNQDSANSDYSITKTMISSKDPSPNDYSEDYTIHESTPFREPNECHLQTNAINSTRVSNEECSIRPGDKVVWILNEKPETGIVKWKGFVGSRIYAGIEFERQLGIPIGDVHTDSLQYIFRFKAGHGRLVPAQELIRYEQFYSDADSKLKTRKLSFQKLKLHSCSQQ